jgi:organic radical activating enzyme
MSNPLFQDALEKLLARQEELKAVKSTIKDLENDIPMELEELMIQVRDLKKQAKALKDEHIKLLLEENVEYGEMREKVQTIKEDMAQAKVDLYTAVVNHSRDHGDLDQTFIVEGMPLRVQTQKELSLYLNGKELKASA